ELFDFIAGTSTGGILALGLTKPSKEDSTKPQFPAKELVNLYRKKGVNIIQDRAAIVFAQGFYDGLGYDDVNNQQVIQRAYDEGIVAIELENLFQQKFIPVLWENGIQLSEQTEGKEVSTVEVIDTAYLDDDHYSDKLKLIEEQARAVRDEVLEPLGIYQENLDKYRQVFTKLVDEQGYSLSQEDKAELKKLQEHYQLKDEDIALLFKEAEQQQAEKLQQQQEAERLRQEHRKAEYQAKLHRYEQELSKAVNVAYPLDKNVRDNLKNFQQSNGLQDEDVARVEQSVIAPKEAEYQRQLETQRLQQPAPSNDLPSDRNVDYTRLRDFLKAGQWKQADEETLAVMLKASGREEEGWLSSKSIENFPCTDLRTIDKLWVEYSNGRFGFSVQKRIWESVGKDVGKLGDAIGWRKGGGTLGLMGWMNWIDYSQVTFDTKAPPGHLPVGGGGGGSVFLFFPVWSVCLFSRVETCKL
ncbi:MAG: GUN4 domain-containing protein, partial [Scytonema sp. PMC 1070.18]|nr:GUN4 domain-containing protein [Scytonema sp. PMC 1070.18]